MRMPQRLGQLDLVQEFLARSFVHRHTRKHHFDGSPPAALFMPSQIHRAKTAAAESFLDFIPRNDGRLRWVELAGLEEERHQDFRRVCISLVPTRLAHVIPPPALANLVFHLFATLLTPHRLGALGGLS